MDSYSFSIVQFFISYSIIMNDCSKDEELSFLKGYINSLFSDHKDDSSRFKLLAYATDEVNKFYSDD